MAKIRIDIDALKSNSSSIENRINELQSLNTRLTNLINRIQSSWEGQACEIYIAKITVQAEKARKMIDVLVEYKKYVDTTISKFSATDNSAAHKIKSSF